MGKLSGDSSSILQVIQLVPSKAGMSCFNQAPLRLQICEQIKCCSEPLNFVMICYVVIVTEIDFCSEMQ